MFGYVRSVWDERASPTVGLLSAHDTRCFFLFALVAWELDTVTTDSALGGPVRRRSAASIPLLSTGVMGDTGEMLVELLVCRCDFVISLAWIGETALVD
jgi:hypothetical protein